MIRRALSALLTELFPFDRNHWIDAAPSRLLGCIIGFHGMKPTGPEVQIGGAGAMPRSV